MSKKDRDVLIKAFLEKEGASRYLTPFEEKILKLLVEEGLSTKDIAARIYENDNSSTLDEDTQRIEIRIKRLTRRIQQVYKPVVKVDKEAVKLALIEEVKQSGKKWEDIAVAGFFWGTGLQSLKDAEVQNFGDVVRIGFRRLFRSPGLGLITLNEVERLLYLFGGNWND